MALPHGDAARAFAALAELEVLVDAAVCERSAVAVPSYGGLRPTSTVVLRGAGVEGRGEHVGWTTAAHEAFHEAMTAVARGRARLGDWSAGLARRVSRPYDRAALEAAAIDLALRQHGTNLLRLARVVPRPVRYVVSVAGLADAGNELARTPAIELKLDADPAWDGLTYAGLTRVVILDFKGTGTPADHERAHRALPAALIEDPRPPWSAQLCDVLSLDASITTEADVARLRLRPAAVNLKPARMGGVFEALRAAARCAKDGIAVYLGGMFEIGVGRTQLRALAALLAPDGPNDIAPIGIDDVPPPRPARLAIDGDAEGFGS